MASAQEDFWKGEFGDDYTLRNNGVDFGVSCKNFWGEALGYTKDINSILELGCNRGLNLNTIRSLKKDIKINAVEINKSAALIASQESFNIYIGNITENIPEEFKSDLTFTCGVLIHIAPEFLDKVYRNLFNLSNKYILISEYFSTIPQEILYRGNPSRMWKRDFAHELWELYPSLKLVKYGFDWRYDKTRSRNDLNWFIFSK